MHIEKFLEQYGFTNKQAKIYLATLELWHAPASTIARFCGEHRLTVYSILKELLKKWLVREVTKNKVNNYTAVSPEVIMQEYQAKYEALQAKMPELMAIAENFSSKPRLQFFEGEDGVKQVYEELLKTHEPLFAFLSDDDIAPELKKYLNETFVAKRKKHKIHASVIVRNTKANKQYLSKTNKDKLTETRLIDSEMLGLEGEIILFGENKIAWALYSPKEMSAFVIESTQLYNTLKSIFMFIRNQLPWAEKS